MNPKFFARKIDYKYYKRAQSIPVEDSKNHLESIAISLQQALDNWKYHGGDRAEVDLCLDAFTALWSSVGSDSH